MPSRARGWIATRSSSTAVPRNSPANLTANMPLVQLIQDWAVRKGSTPAQISLAWLMAQRPWLVPIPSTTRTAHLAENLGAEEVVFSGDELTELNRALSSITIHGERLQPTVLAQTGVEARPLEGSAAVMNRRTLMRGSLALGAGALLAACNASDSPNPASPQPRVTADSQSGPSSSNVLLVYFSRAGENYFYGDRIDLEVGNTQVVADMIASSIAVDVYRIQAADPYPDSYDETVQRNKREQDEDTRPAIAGPLPQVARYDTVLLGSPIWNVRPPMIMRTFADSVDLSGKTIHPFVTYAVSGMGDTIDDYTRFCRGATIKEGLAVRGEEVHDARNDVDEWLKRTGLRAD
jgi:flavodoxin